MKDDIHFFGWLILANVTQNKWLAISCVIAALFFAVKMMIDYLHEEE